MHILQKVPFAVVVVTGASVGVAVVTVSEVVTSSAVVTCTVVVSDCVVVGATATVTVHTNEYDTPKISK